MLSAMNLRTATCGLAAAAAGALVLFFVPTLEIELFARGAAQLAGFLGGSPVLRDEAGWMLPSGELPVLVTAACSGADFFLIVAALVGWQLARRGVRPAGAIVAGLAAAVPVAIYVNALRIVAVAQAHRWVIPRLPDAYGAFTHMLTGVAVFLPALIALNVLLEIRRGSAAADVSMRSARGRTAHE
jgi:exosortase/archaeosortase family protein